VLFGTNAQVSRQGLRYADAQTGALISIGLTALLYWLASPLFLRAEYWHSPALFLFLMLGLFHPGMSLFLSYEGLRRIGPTISVTMTSTSPLFATAGAMAVLGESPSGWVLLGTVGIVGGVIVLSWQGTGHRDWNIAALVFPLGAAVVRGMTQMGYKYALNLLPTPFTAVLLSYSVSFVMGSIVFRAVGKPLPTKQGWGLGWFLLSGLINGTAILCLYTALGVGQVSVVAPLVSTFPLFTLALGMLFHLERITRRVYLGVLLVVIGVIVVATL
jgi:drug/metabolite transporter (DMT)-like permease